MATSHLVFRGRVAVLYTVSFVSYAGLQAGGRALTLDICSACWACCEFLFIQCVVKSARTHRCILFAANTCLGNGSGWRRVYAQHAKTQAKTASLALRARLAVRTRYLCFSQ